MRAVSPFKLYRYIAFNLQIPFDESNTTQYTRVHIKLHSLLFVGAIS